MNIFYCKHCKRIVFSYQGSGTLTCCGDDMTLLQPKTRDLGNEKHLPVVERIAPDQIKVSIGSVPHPMAQDHWVQWVYLTQDDRYQIKTFQPGETPIALFRINPDQPFKVYEFCNLHGLWLSE